MLKSKDIIERRTMKNMARFLICVIFMVIMLSAFGCGTPGESAAEVHRRHQRVVDNAAQQMAEDVDSLFMLDQPSRLSDKRVR